MANERLYIQRLRTNDLIDNGGKQFEVGKSWCEDFFGIPTEKDSATIELHFKAIDKKYQYLNDSVIELKLGPVTKRGDRKAYANGESRRSQIKDFLIDKLHLTDTENTKDYIGLLKSETGIYDFFFIPELLYKNFISKLKDNVPEIIHKEETEVTDVDVSILSRQIIYYGAPGTGKSFRINEVTKDNENVIRTTFHPDSDYSTFVGAYKPTMKSFKRSDHGYMLDGDGHEREREEITYEFVPQAFLQAYVQAWTLLANAATDNDIKPEFLVIEEINRGNCAQIFGDLFQLLDRGDEGFSDYPIHADKDLQGYLRKKFAEVLTNKDEQTANLVRAYGNEDTIERLLDGEILLLPRNLYIWATMNTSDQSLFPIDSAFKRRWDWKYVPISQGKDKTGTPLQWKIQVNGKQFDWWSFLQKINDRIYKATESEDKQLGFFFCKADRNGIVTAERFVNKVIFYLWNDVFKDYDTKGVFPDDYATFDKFFTGEGDANETAVDAFLTGLEVDQNAPETTDQPAEPQEDEAE